MFEMKVCLFADIHGNGPAFRSAYPRLISEKADMNIFLGDLCGYYFDQLEIFQMLEQIPNLTAIKGNHDNIYLKITDGDKELGKHYMKKYGSSMEKLLSNRSDELNRWFSDLPESFFLSDLDIAGYHGSQQDHLEGYIYPDSPLDEFLDYAPSVFMLAHTHYPMIRSVGNKTIINPGSLGQPRHGGWPSYALFNSVTKDVEFREVKYDMSELTRSIDMSGDSNPYLRKVLERVKDE